MGASPTEFELEGKRFEVRRLSPDDACQGLEVLGKVLGPAAIEVLSARASDGEDGAASPAASPNYAAILQALLVNARQIAVLLKLFAPRAKFDRGGNGILVDLGPFVDEVFAGRVDLMVAFLIHAVRAEYASFLGGGGALGQLVTQLGGSASPSPRAPTG